MAMSNSQFIIERRRVKHVRLRVRGNCSVEAIVPVHFDDAQVQAVLDAKVKWIEKARSFFKAHPPTFSENQDELFLFGQAFSFVWDGAVGRSVAIDEESRTIRAARDLNSKDIRSKWYRNFARDFLQRRTRDLAEAHGFTFNRIYVMNQRTVWGNCSKKQNVSLNWQLIRAPRFVIDYVILHELLHTRFMSHGQAFWRSMSRLHERHKEAIAWLHSNRPVVSGALN
jgi:predicted metal-dependent hydrolase